jgi:hypothetical protein
MIFFFRMKFRGSLQRQAFQIALETALARHPLLQVVLRRSRNGHQEWESVESLRPQVHWDTDSNRVISVAFLAIDLQNEVGLRIYISKLEGRTVALFQFHNACAGGASSAGPRPKGYLNHPIGGHAAGCSV